MQAAGDKNLHGFGIALWILWWPHAAAVSAPCTGPLPVETVRVSATPSPLPQGETEILADVGGRVVVVWMDGSPVSNSTQMTLRTTSSSDAGRSFGSDWPVDASLILGDPSLDCDSQGTFFLSALRKDSVFSYSDLALVLFRSYDGGSSWSTPVVISDDDIFNDRPWIDVDARDGVHAVRSPRIPRPDGSGNWDRPIYYHHSTDGGSSFSPAVLVNASVPAGTAGGSARGIAVDPSGAILVAVQSAPYNNAPFNGGAIGRLGHLYRGSGGTFDGPFEFTLGGVYIAPASAAGPGDQPFPRMKAHTSGGLTTAYVVWVGDPGGGASGIYLAALRPGATFFDAPVPIVTGTLGSFRLPTLAIDEDGQIHVLWMEEASGEWSVRYALSVDGGRTFVQPCQLGFSYPVTQWPGDFMGAWANHRDVLLAWPVAGGPAPAIYVSILRGAVSAADVIVGAGFGPPNPNRIRILDGYGASTPTDFLPYSAGVWGAVASAWPGFRGGVGILTGPGPGPRLGPQVRAADRTGSPIGAVNFFAYATLRFGVNPASESIDGDAFAEILTGAGQGAVFGPHVRAFNYDDTRLDPIAKVSFYAYGTLKYGVNGDGGDVDADGFGEIVTGPGPGANFAPQVRAFNVDGGAVSTIAKINFNAFPIASHGANVASDEVESDGFAEIVVAAGAGPSVAGDISGFNYDGSSVSPLPGFTARPFVTMFGARLGLADVSSGQAADLLAGPGPEPSAASDLRTYVYAGTVLEPRFVGPALPGLTFGVNVAGGALGF